VAVVVGVAGVYSIEVAVTAAGALRLLEIVVIVNLTCMRAYVLEEVGEVLRENKEAVDGRHVEV
jgi:hypothetical protein